MRGFISFLFLLSIALLLSVSITQPFLHSTPIAVAILRHDDALRQQLLLNTHYHLSNQFQQYLATNISEPLTLQTLLAHDLQSFWQENGVQSTEIIVPMDWKVIVTPLDETHFSAKAYYLPFAPVSFSIKDSVTSISLPFGYALSYPAS